MASAEALTKALGGRWSGGRGVAFCPAHENRRTPALSIGENREGRLLLHCFAGCAFADVLAALKSRGLEPEGAPPDAFERERRRAADEQDRRDRAERCEGAARLWSRTLEMKGTQAEAYLKARGLTPPFGPALRFAPRLKHPTGAYAPAMVARIDGAEGFAVHRTWLEPSGAPCKAAGLEPQKAMLGAARGGAVRLRQGRPDRLAVAEGLETMLAAGGGLGPDWSLWAALSASGMKALRLPDAPGELLICADGDAPGRAAAQALARRAMAAGWGARIADPGDGLDFADLLMMGGRRHGG